MTTTKDGDRATPTGDHVVPTKEQIEASIARGKADRARAEYALTGRGSPPAPTEERGPTDVEPHEHERILHTLRWMTKTDEPETFMRGHAFANRSEFDDPVGIDRLTKLALRKAMRLVSDLAAARAEVADLRRLRDVVWSRLDGTDGDDVVQLVEDAVVSWDQDVAEAATLRAERDALAAKVGAAQDETKRAHDLLGAVLRALWVDVLGRPEPSNAGAVPDPERVVDEVRAALASHRTRTAAIVEAATEIVKRGFADCHGAPACGKCSRCRFRAAIAAFKEGAGVVADDDDEANKAADRKIEKDSELYVAGWEHGKRQSTADERAACAAAVCAGCRNGRRRNEIGDHVTTATVNGRTTEATFACAAAPIWARGEG